MCFDGRRQFVVSAPCTNCHRRQFVQETTICGVRFCKILHKLSSTTICAGTTICGATPLLLDQQFQKSFGRIITWQFWFMHTLQIHTHNDHNLRLLHRIYFRSVVLSSNIYDEEFVFMSISCMHVHNVNPVIVITVYRCVNKRIT